jgi:hypothetical protein
MRIKKERSAMIAEKYNGDGVVGGWMGLRMIIFFPKIIQSSHTFHQLKSPVSAKGKLISDSHLPPTNPFSPQIAL